MNLRSLALSTYRQLRHWRNFVGPHRFINRSHGHKRLAVILTGYYPNLWPATLERLAALHFTATDICLVCAGAPLQPVAEIAERNNWSLLHTRSRHPGLGLNLAIQNHPQANWIHKLDEDIVLPKNYFADLETGYQRVASQGKYRLGIYAPLINVNPFSYAPFLEKIGAAPDYIERFGPLLRGTFDIPAYHDAQAAKVLWDASLPFDDAAAKIAAQAWSWEPIPHRFCIGAILMERSWWQELGGIRRPFAGTILGADEEHLCFATQTRGRILGLDHSILVGHLGFGPQRAGLAKHLPQLIQALSLNKALS